jgi:hypothetical protein
LTASVCRIKLSYSATVIFLVILPFSNYFNLFLFSASEKSLQASLSAAEMKLSQSKKKLALLSASRALSRDRYERRIDFVEHSMGICDKNNQKKVRRNTLAEAEVLMNKVLISHSLPPQSLTSDDIGEDEIPRQEDDDYYYESSGEDFDEDGNLVDKDGKILFKADFAGKDGKAPTESSHEDITRSAGKIGEEGSSEQIVDEALLKNAGDTNEDGA